MKRKQAKKVRRTLRKGIRQLEATPFQKTLLAGVLLIPGGTQVIVDAVKDHAEADGEIFAADWLDNLDRLLELFIKWAPTIIEIIERLFPSE